jgi:hypothetical protein
MLKFGSTSSGVFTLAAGIRQLENAVLDAIIHSQVCVHAVHMNL